MIGCVLSPIQALIQSRFLKQMPTVQVAGWTLSPSSLHPPGYTDTCAQDPVKSGGHEDRKKTRIRDAEPS